MNLPLANAQDTALALAAPFSLEFGNVLLEFIEVVHAVIADADGPDLASFYSLDELTAASPSAT